MTLALALELGELGAARVPLFVLGTDRAEDDVRRLSRLRVEAYLLPEDRVAVGVVGEPEPLVGRAVTAGERAALGPALAPGTRYAVALRDAQAGGWVQLLGLLPEARLGRGPPGSTEMPPGDPRALLALGQTQEEGGDLTGAEDAYFQALEVYPNFLPALVALAEARLDGPLASAAFVRAAALAPEDPRVRGLVTRRRAAAGEEEVRELLALGARVDLGAPFREQWAGCLAAPRRRLEPLTRVGVYEAFLRAAFADHRMERWEEDLARQLAGALGLDAEERRAAYRRAAAGVDRSLATGQGALDRADLFRQLAGLACADGVVEAEEAGLLDRSRELLEVPPEAARAALLEASAGEEVRAAVDAFLARPCGEEEARRVRERLLLGAGTLRPGTGEAYATLLDRVRAHAPEALVAVLFPLGEVARYSQRLLDAFAAALEVAVAGPPPARRAAMDAVRANAHEVRILDAAARGLRASAEGGGPLEELLRDIELLALLRPPTAEVWEHLRAVEVLASGSAPARPRGARDPEGTARGSRLLGQLREAAGRGRRRELLDALDGLEAAAEADPAGSTLAEAGRLEAGMAAAFHGWDDLYRVCLGESRSGAPWEEIVLRLAGLDRARRVGDAGAEEALDRDLERLLAGARLSSGRRRFVERVRRWRSPPTSRGGDPPTAPPR